MMLSRTAENLFWMGRYMERAESTARLIEMGQRMTMLPGSYTDDEWRSVAKASGSADRLNDEAQITESTIIRTLILDLDNSSSIRSCLERARANGRAVRSALTRDMWEALNDNWRRLEGVEIASVRRDLPTLLDWVKARAMLFRGAAATSMLRNEGYFFLLLGSHIERADMTLRLLDVKYYVLLPESDAVGGGRDYHHWTSVLHATSAMRAFHHVYRGDYSPWKIADFLILNPAFPRSVSLCYSQIGGYLDRLADRHGTRNACQSNVHEMIRQLETVEMGELFQEGLHEFIMDTISRTRQLTFEVYEDYHL